MDPIEFVIIGITIAAILFSAMRLFLLPIRTLELSIEDERETPSSRQPWHERTPSTPAKAVQRTFEPIPLPQVTTTEEKAAREKEFNEVVVSGDNFTLMPHASKN